MTLLCKLATSIYVVSRMGVTCAIGTINAALVELLGQVKVYSRNVTAVVGFSVSTHEHLQNVSKIADGVKEASSAQRAKAVEEYWAHVICI